jgi:hypothetical protein
MIKMQTDDNELVTKGFLRTTLRETINEAIDGLAATINKNFEGLESRMATREDLAALTQRVVGLEKDMKGMHDNFHIVFAELKGIRDRLDRIEKNDVTPNIVNLDLRVKKLEKKAGLQ